MAAMHRNSVSHGSGRSLAGVEGIDAVILGTVTAGRLVPVRIAYLLVCTGR